LRDDVAHQYQTHILRDGFYKIVEEHDIDHRALIHNQNITLQLPSQRSTLPTGTSSNDPVKVTRSL
jgi:hypothetical protein